MTYENKIYILIKNDEVLIYHSIHGKPIPDDAILITHEQEAEYLYALNHENKLLWLDSKGKIQIREKLSIWDAKSKTFIPDKVAIDAQAKEQLINDATISLKNDVQYSLPYFTDKFTSNQQTQIITYLDSLYDIVFNPKTQQTLLPTRPTFLP